MTTLSWGATHIENFAQYVELTAYPQRSALEPLLTERKV